MSSNAPVRSRPRVRHQRVPRTHSCDHPRFLRLVNELARINEAKKLEEAESGISTSSGRCDGLHGGANSYAPSSKIGSSSTTVYSAPPLNHHQQQQLQFHHATPTNLTTIPNKSNSSYHSAEAGQSICQPSASGPTPGCCSSAQTSNGYRTIDNRNQSASTLHDNYYHQQNTQHQQPHQNFNQNLHHSHPNISLNSQQQNHLNSNNLHQQQADRCPAKNVAPNPSFPKQGLSEQNSLGYNSDLRQDENRSKRKRSTTDFVVKKSSSSSCGNASSSSKRYKSSPEEARPLSPSFTKCPICLLDSMDRDPSFTNTCFHLFCYSCIENWAKSKTTCPLCRTKFTKIIYKIRSATNYEEKTASPIRRDDDDGYIADRLMLEHLSTLNSNSSASNRATSNEEVQFLFENLRNNEVLGMPLLYSSHVDHRQSEGPLHPFNAVPTSNNFNSAVPPHQPFTTTSYPMASNYIIFQDGMAPATSNAIVSAYNANSLLANDASNPRRAFRGGRSVPSRTYFEAPVLPCEGLARTTTRGPTAPNASAPNNPLERNQHHHHHHQHQHSHHHHAAHHQSQHHHPHHQQRSTVDMGSRPNLRIEQSYAHANPLPNYQFTRHYPAPTHTRRIYNNPQVNHHIIDTLYGHVPDI